MKATGIVKRIDDLGRVCIPTVIRKMVGLEDDDRVEIYIEDANVVLKKYAPKINPEEIIKSSRDIIKNNISLIKEDETLTHAKRSELLRMMNNALGSLPDEL